MKKMGPAGPFLYILVIMYKEETCIWDISA